jgi:putative PIG3 family NAD(P)H quinone oxidoreductase
VKAIVVEGGRGGPDALRLVETPTPSAAEGQILIAVAAAGVNRPDILQRQGLYPPPPGAPPTLGLEVAGQVVQGAGRWRSGDHVCALLPGGGYAQFAVCDPRHALPIPRGLDLPEAGGLPETVFTVWANVFEHGSLRAGETLMVHGGTSGIGVTAIQMAKACGAKVMATARGSAKAQETLGLGADVAVDTTTEDFETAAKEFGGVDVILDMVGGSYFQKNLEALRTGGRLVWIAAQGGPTVEAPIIRVMQKRLVLTGSTLRPRDPDEKARLAAEVERVVWPWIEDGKVRCIIDRAFPLRRAGQAHAYLEAGSHLGKVMLTVQ